MKGRSDMARHALQSLARKAGSARLGDRLPEARRNALRIEIGLDPADDPDAEVHGEASDSDPELPGRKRPGGADPDAEIYGEADDDDPELPGVTRMELKARRARQNGGR